MIYVLLDGDLIACISAFCTVRGVFLRLCATLLMKRHLLRR